MRLWMVEPELLCRKHLLGEHVECHMFMGALNKGTSIAGYLRDGLFDGRFLQERHEQLALELVKRGYNHKSPLQDAKYPDDLKMYIGSIDIQSNLEDLRHRCIKCAERQNRLE